MKTTQTRIVLLLSGKRFAGKDTVAEALQHLLKRYFPKSAVETFALAAECKRLYCEKAGGLDPTLFTNREFKETHRANLTAFFENSDVNFAQVVAERIELRKVDIAIVADWRFEADYEAISKWFSQCVRLRVNADDEQKIQRGWSFDRRKDTDPTEVSLDGARFDFTIDNNATVASIEQQLKKSVLPCIQTLMDCKQAQTVRTYDFCSKTYSQDVQRQMLVQRAILEHCVEDKTVSVLDIGCGAGIIGHTLDAHFKREGTLLPLVRVNALDVSLEMCREANKAPNCVAECCDWMLYDCTGVQYDLVVGQAYLHLYEPEKEAVEHLRKMLRATKRRCYVSTTLETHFSQGVETKETAASSTLPAPKRFRVRHTAVTWLKLMREALCETLAKRFRFVVWKMRDTDGRTWINTLFYDASLSEEPHSVLQHCYSNQGFVVVHNFESHTQTFVSICEKVKLCPFDGLLRYEVASGFDRAENMICFKDTFGVLSAKLKTLCASTVAKSMDDLVYLKDKLNYKQSGRGEFPAHQDARAGWSSYAKEHFTVALALDLCNAKSGALQVVAEPLKAQKLLDGPNPIGKEEELKREWTLLEMYAGDVVLFNSLLLHRSGTNNTKRDRKLWLVTFVSGINAENRESIEKFYENKRLRQPTMDDGAERDAPRDAFGKLIFSK